MKENSVRFVSILVTDGWQTVGSTILADLETKHCKWEYDGILSR